MITELYVFSPSSFVVAEEWNANFRILYDTSLAHLEAITDAQATVAFPNSDLTDVYNAVRAQQNSFAIPGNTVVVAPECEYYKTLTADETLTINIPQGLNAEARICLYLTADTTLRPISVAYAGTQIIDDGGWQSFRSGYYFVLIYEANNLAQVKLLFTGV